MSRSPKLSNSFVYALVLLLVVGALSACGSAAPAPEASNAVETQEPATVVTQWFQSMDDQVIAPGRGNLSLSRVIADNPTLGQLSSGLLAIPTATREPLFNQGLKDYPNVANWLNSEFNSAPRTDGRPGKGPGTWASSINWHIVEGGIQAQRNIDITRQAPDLSVDVATGVGDINAAVGRAVAQAAAMLPNPQRHFRTLFNAISPRFGGADYAKSEAAFNTALGNIRTIKGDANHPLHDAFNDLFKYLP